MEKYIKTLLFGEMLKIQSRILRVMALDLIKIYKNIKNLPKKDQNIVIKYFISLKYRLFYHFYEIFP